MKLKQISKWMLCILLLSVLSLSVVLSSCSKTDSSPYENDRTKYNLSGTNWQGHITGQVTIKVDEIGHFATIVSSTSYTAHDLIIPQYVYVDGIAYTMSANGFTLNSEYVTGTIYVPPSFIYVGGKNDAIAINCPNAETVIFPATVTELFSHSINVKYIKIPKTITYIGSEAFKDCTAINEIVISDGITNINDKTFYNCIGLTKITLPYDLLSISEYAFWGCENLATIEFGKYIRKIDNHAFGLCTSLPIIFIGESVTEMGESVFASWTELQTIKLPWYYKQKPAKWNDLWSANSIAKIEYR